MEPRSVPLRLASRGSPLALHQTDLVAQALRAGHPGLEIEVVVVRTQGDDLSAPLDQIGGQGVFVTEVEAAVADGRADAAVHSAKDMTSVMSSDLVLAAVPLRADARDGLVGCALVDLPPGGLIATGSARRRAQLAYARPDLSFIEIRGNMERRVGRGEDGSVTAVVVAVAAMERLGWMHRLTDILDPVDVLPQAGQGAIAVQCRADDEVTRALLSAIDDPESHRAVRAERSVLAGLGGSCTVPVGAWAETVPGSPELRVQGLVASGDGRVVIRMSRRGEDPELVGAEVAHALLIDGGGSGIEGFDEVAALSDSVSAPGRSASGRE
jgi:hydroxymethylbilane synthase